MKLTQVLCGILLATSCIPALAQHDMSNMSGMGDISVATMPTDDAVMAMAPQSLMLQFEDEHVLVKLVLKDPEPNFIDINFRFDPTAKQHSSHALPPLELADYYEVEWAALDAEGKLHKGTFHFSFGPDAKPPSFYLSQEEHNMPMIMTPDYRLQ